MKFCYSCMHQFEDAGQTTCPKCGEPLDWTIDTKQYLPPGSRLQGKFIVGRCLGAGGFGNTYIGWNEFLQCKVAIKEYYPRHLSSRAEDGVTVSVSGEIQQQQFRMGLEQFIEEARSLATLQEIRGVIKVYSFFEANGTGYIAMEYLEGMDVKEILKERGGILDYATARRVILTVLHTLRGIHEKGVIHRDIAPDNVYVTKEGVIKLIDFGAARHSDDESERTEIVLKVGYAPIEQYSRTAVQGPYTDLYATAALFYRLLTGKKPQPANERMIEDQVKTLSELGIHIPEQAEMAIMCCLNIQPEFRLQNAEDFMEALNGKDFEPVYEPKWILPEIPDVEETKGIRFFDGLPLAIRIGVVIVFLAVIVGGSIGIVKLRGSKGLKMIMGKGTQIQIPPDCMNQPEEEVLSKLEESGLNAEVTYVYDAFVQSDIVSDIEPAEGSTIRSDETVQLEVKTKDKLTLPGYVGKNRVDVQKSLKKLLGDQYNSNFFQYTYDDTVDKDICYWQSVAEGEILNVENVDTFRINVSWGKEDDYEKNVPDLTGLTLERAKQKLFDAGIPSSVLKKTGSAVYNSSVPAGCIVSQSIEAGKKVNVNSEDSSQFVKNISVVLSKGAKPKKTPKPQSPSKSDSQPIQKDKKNQPIAKQKPKKDDPFNGGIHSSNKDDPFS